MFLTKVAEKIKSSLCSVTFFPENHAVYEIMGKNTAEPDRPKMTCRMHISCWISKARNTRSEYVIIIAFQLQLWLHERESMLRYTHIARLV